jgi:hypothetical protein
MGQSPHLLDLPGFASVTAAAQANEYELSRRFAARVKSEIDKLVASGKAEVMDGWVALIQHCDAPRPDLVDKVGKSLGLNSIQINKLKTYNSASPPYRLLVMEADGSPRLVYACKIDLCTGGGPPRLREAAGVEDDLFTAYQGKPWEPPANRTAFRYLISGIEALHDASPLAKGARLCIHGSGGVGVNLVETAMDSGKWVDWMAPGTHHEVFVASGRNDVLLKPGSSGRIPFHRRLRFGEGVGIAKIAAEEIVFEPGKPPDGQLAGPKLPEVVDYYADVVTLKEGGFPYGTQCMLGRAPAGEGYGQLIVTQGLESSPERHGSPASLARAFESEGGVELIIPLEDGRVAGLQTLNGDVRILGSAATAMVWKDSGYQDPLEKSKTYHKRLPLQAHVGSAAGITYNAVTVALANRYFTLTEPHLNRNVNTAHPRELQVILGDRDLAAEIVELRPKVAPWGYRTLEELTDALGESTADLPTDWKERIKALRCDYHA